ncbi:MAG: HAD family hydrolase [bacterium]
MVSRIVFDLDDTLVHTGRTFRRQLERFATRVCQRFEAIESTETVLEQQKRVDKKLLSDDNLDLKHFPESLVETWRFYCDKYDRSVETSDLEECRRIGWAVYEMVPEPLAGLESVMKRLQGDYELTLYTMGSPDVQYRKIDSFELRRWFSTLHITPRKSVDVLERIIHPHPPDQVMIVGDSLRTEIQHGLQLGMKVIHRDPEDIWHFHKVSIDESFPSIKQLEEVLDHLP